jgi:hypothetical protein
MLKLVTGLYRFKDVPLSKQGSLIYKNYPGGLSYGNHSIIFETDQIAVLEFLPGRSDGACFCTIIDDKVGLYLKGPFIIKVLSYRKWDPLYM